MTPQERLVAVARKYVGYKEKASNKQLDSFTANAGKRNYTIFAKLMDGIKGWYNGRKQGVAWCAVFVHRMFVEAFGAEAAQKMLFIPKNSSAAGVRYARQYFLRKKRLFPDPQIGDEIFFTDPKRMDINYGKHTGIVAGHDAIYVHTIEGNVSNAVGVRSYRRNDPSISGYGRPDWSLVEDAHEPVKNAYTFVVPNLTAGQAEAERDRLRQAYGACEMAVG